MNSSRFFFLDGQKHLGLLFFFFVLQAFSFLSLFLFFLPEFPQNLTPPPSFSAPQGLSFESLVEGPLFLRSPSFTPQVLDFAKEISISLLSERPDRAGKKRGEILLSQTQERKIFASQERIYLSLQEKTLKFSKKPSILWIEPSLEKKGIAELKIGMEGDEKIGVAPLLFSAGIVITEIPFSKEKQIEAEWLQKLVRAKWQGEDFLSFFSRKNQEDGKKHQRLEVENFSLLVQEGDWLSFQENHWQLVKEHKNTEKYPLAVVGSVKEQQMEIEVFEEGGRREKIVLNKQVALPFKTNPEEWISAFHLRSFSSLSLVLEKQHLFLRKGGWACRKAGHWKILKNPSLLSMAGAEAFFFFEGVEEKNGQKWWKGHFMNGSGTLDHRIEKPISPKKKRTLSDPIIIEREKEKKP